MREKIEQIFQIYCQNEVEDFKKNELSLKLNELQKTKEINVEYGFSSGKAKSNSQNLYFYVNVFDKNNQIIQICDEVCFSIATTLISIDKKERIRFYSWKDEDFIEDLVLMINYLEKL